MPAAMPRMSGFGRPLSRAALALALLLGAAAPVTPQNQAASPAPIRNFLQISADFCTGGQPRPEHFAQLKAQGVKAVLNLRTPGEHRAEEEQQAVIAAGLKYFNIPVVYTTPRPEQVDEFLRITDEAANRPMFIHCTAAIRVGGFWLIRRVLRDGWPWETALDEARTVGLVQAPHLEAFAKNYIAAARARR